MSKLHWIQDTEVKLQHTRYRGLNSRIQDTGVKLQDTILDTGVKLKDTGYRG